MEPMMTDEQRPDRDLCTVELTQREVALLLKYGYPLPEAEAALRSSKAVDGFQRVKIGDFWIEHLIADLVRSMKEIRGRGLLEELDEFCDTLEVALDRKTTLWTPFS